MGILKIQKLTKLNQQKLVLHRVLLMWKLSAMCFGKLVDLDKSVINYRPWLLMALYSCGFDFINVLDGRELDFHHGLWTQSKANVEHVFVLDIRFPSWKLEITTSELIKRVWYLSFLPRLLVQSNWSELCLSDQFNLSSGPFLGYKPWLLDREKDNANPVLWLASRGHFRAYVQSFSSREDSHMNTKERILTPRVFSTVIKTKYCVECLQGQRVLKIVVPELLA